MLKSSVLVPHVKFVLDIHYKCDPFHHPIILHTMNVWKCMYLNPQDIFKHLSKYSKPFKLAYSHGLFSRFSLAKSASFQKEIHFTGCFCKPWKEQQMNEWSKKMPMYTRKRKKQHFVGLGITPAMPLKCPGAIKLSPFFKWSKHETTFHPLHQDTYLRTK